MAHGGSDTPSSSSSHFKDGLIDLAAGTVGGIANVYAGQPLDTVKVKVQTYPHLYKNWVTCFGQTFKLDGVRGLYAGTTPALVANIAENAVLFTAYGFCQKSIAWLCSRPSVKEMSWVENAASGSFAAVFAALVLTPTELVKCQLQAQREAHPNWKGTPMTICREMYARQGARAFATGLVPTLAREVPGYFFFFGAYELTRALLTAEGQNKDDLGLWKTAVAGAMGGTALWTAIFPADVVKSRVQVQGGGKFGEVFMQVLKEQGPVGLYKGLTPTVIRACLASGSLFIAYENTKKFLHNQV